jgi:hypothetical protein
MLDTKIVTATCVAPKDTPSMSIQYNARYISGIASVVNIVARSKCDRLLLLVPLANYHSNHIL